MNDDNRLYKINRRRKVMREIGGCDRCPPHAKENYFLKGHKPTKSWKWATSRRRQYKTV